MSSKKTDTALKVIRGLEEKLLRLDKEDGSILVSTDSGRMWMDTSSSRISLGGSGASLLYASSTVTQISDADGNYSYVIDKSDLDDPNANPQVDDLILNSDGSFYRITTIDGDDLTCARLAVSGNGSGSGPISGSKAMTIKGKPLETATLVNGQDAEIKFTVNSALDANGEPEDEELVVTWSLFVTSTGTKYDGNTFKVKSGVEHTFQFGSKLRESTGSTLTLYATGANSGKSKVISYEMTTVELLLYESEKFNNIAPYGSTFTMYCNVSGNIEKIIEYSIDGEVVGTKQLAKSASGEQSLTVNNIPHGAHTVTIDLFQSIDGEKGVGVKKPLSFEIAVNDGVTKDPIIWVGDYASTFYNYDPIKIPFRVFDPTQAEVNVNFVKGITIIGNRLEKSGATAFSYWQITDAKDIGVLNTYSIQVAQNITDAQGNVLSTKIFSKEVRFTVEQDPDRNLVYVSPESLMLKFDAAGRSNNDSETIRTTWSYKDTTSGTEKTYNAKFENFNWNNNGWILDDNNDTCLRISNGAKFSIPIGNMVMNNPSETAQQSKTFEFEFKVRNVQNYSNLIKEYTRYSGDLEYWNAFVAQMDDENGFDNYDNYLKYVSTLPDAKADYDTITATFSDITRLVASSTPFCSYYDTNGHGLCLGPQDGFFSSAQNTLNVKYVEDQLINLSIVFNYTDKRLYIYLQGVLTAVCKITDTSALGIAADNIIFNSEYCDVDLYKFRIYNSALSVRDILINYSVDHTSLADYDHTTKLISYNRDTGEYQLDYSLMKAWNRGEDEDGDNISRPDYLMPYVIWNTGAKTAKLPYSKADEKHVGMTFVNTALDYAYKTGELEDLANDMTDKEKEAAASEELTLAQYYYKHHCPSWTSDGLTVALAVQGTSSEFYPRRNYKAKPKDSDDVIHMFMNRGPFADDYNTYLTKYKLQIPELKEDKSNQAAVDEAKALDAKVHLEWFYFNNTTYGANKFTMKIDFMESSGTYNMGLANLVHTSYGKHPIDDYNKAGAFHKKGYIKDAGSAYDSKTKYYADNKGKTEVKFEGGDVVWEPNKYYVTNYTNTTVGDTDKLRTNAQGFPVMAFWQYGDKDSDFQFIGRYNYLSDKGSDETYGFKTDKSITSAFLSDKATRDIAECWEYSDNARGFCSFKDPKGRHKLNFDVYTSELSTELKADGYEKATEETPVEDVKYYSYDEANDAYTEVTFTDGVTTYAPNVYYKEKMVEVPAIKKIRQYNSKNSCPFVADSFEYRYNKKKDFLDYIYNPAAVSTDDYNALLEDYTAKQLSDIEYRSEQLFKLYKNWEKACQWVWSTCTDNVPSEADRAAGKATARKIMTYTLADPEKVSFNPNLTYYDENEDEVVEPNETAFNLKAYYIGTPTPKTFSDGSTYEYETKEYRLAKFTNELQDHFDLEYCLVYFVITEVLLLYDSRGKNCMMASWGPQKSGGDYVWYPVFYDMDTQLGINNTGIPSFEYSENATIDGTFSTSDNVLWNNLYACFQDNIESKYADLRHTISNSRYTGPGPLADVPHIEAWYLADPNESGEIEMRGARPLAMFNMDEQFKYISICNPTIQYQNRQGGMSTDTNGEFFYALQGNRSLSRQQFLARRLNFIDSWLSQGNYSRSDGTSIEGRIGANNPELYSDKWINKPNASADSSFEVQPYYNYLADGVTPVVDDRGYPKKNQYLDADFFVELTPYQKSYVALGLDNESFPSKEYEDKEVRYEFPESNKAGIMDSPKLKESLIYIYGADALSDMGDVSTLYWSQFKANHAPHLQRILLGNDHPRFYNRGLSSPGFDASSDSDWGKPLLKEVNLSGLTLSTDGLTDFDFTSSEKLQIFKAVRSNITSVKFADGVALHTLYLPGTVKSLALTKAANLDTVLTDLSMEFNDATYTDPERNTYYSTFYPATNSWVAKKGLYIAGLTDFNEADLVPNTSECALAQIEIDGGVLGYGSYDLLHKLYTIYRYGGGEGQKELKIAMTDVDWSPYKKLDKDAAKKDDGKYYVDDEHYGFKPYTYVNEKQWKLDLLNGEVYELNEAELAANKDKITDVTMLLDFINRNQFKNTTSTGTSTPVLTGSIFINNSADDPVDENLIRNTLLLDSAFPGKKLDIHFAHVTKGYAAKFIQLEADGTYEVLGTQVIANGAPLTSRFTNPYDVYTASRDNYDFWGWSVTNDKDGVIPKEQWATSTKSELVKGQTEYVFYAIFTRHEFKMTFKYGTVADGFQDLTERPIGVLYGDYITPPNVIPALNEEKLDDTERYRFLGWGQDINNTIVTSANKAKVVDVSKMQAIDDLTFYAVFIRESVYDSITNTDYFDFIEYGYTDMFEGKYSFTEKGYYISVKKEDVERNIPKYYLTGKITLPTYYNGKPVYGIWDSGFIAQRYITHIYFKEEPDKPTKIVHFRANAFYDCYNMKHVDMPTSLRNIGSYCFYANEKLVLTGVGNNVAIISDGAFNQALTTPPGAQRLDFRIGASVKELGDQCFTYCRAPFGTVTFGDDGQPSQLTYVPSTTSAFMCQSNYWVQKYEFYCTPDRQSFFENLPGPISSYPFEMEDPSKAQVILTTYSEREGNI